tara:strand:+ start:103 stop:342 length:240 start_codon:yes stop_codon:yes gene_type:complete
MNVFPKNTTFYNIIGKNLLFLFSTSGFGGRQACSVAQNMIPADRAWGDGVCFVLTDRMVLPLYRAQWTQILSVVICGRS